MVHRGLHSGKTPAERAKCCLCRAGIAASRTEHRLDQHGRVAAPKIVLCDTNTVGEEIHYTLTSSGRFPVFQNDSSPTAFMEAQRFSDQLYDEDGYAIPFSEDSSRSVIQSSRHPPVKLRGNLSYHSCSMDDLQEGSFRQRGSSIDDLLQTADDSSLDDNAIYGSSHNFSSVSRQSADSWGGYRSQFHGPKQDTSHLQDNVSYGSLNFRPNGQQASTDSLNFQPPSGQQVSVDLQDNVSYRSLNFRSNDNLQASHQQSIDLQDDHSPILRAKHQQRIDLLDRHNSHGLQVQRQQKRGTHFSFKGQRSLDSLDFQADYQQGGVDLQDNVSYHSLSSQGSTRYHDTDLHDKNSNNIRESRSHQRASSGRVAFDLQDNRSYGSCTLLLGSDEEN